MCGSDVCGADADVCVVQVCGVCEDVVTGWRRLIGSFIFL